MQTIPTLVGTGTAVAAAATGLVFSQPPNPNPPLTQRPTSNKRKFTLDRDPPFFGHFSGVSHPSRPDTSSAQVTPSEEKPYTTLPHYFSPSAAPPSSSQQRPVSTHFTPKRGHSRRLSLNRPVEYPAHPTVEDHRDSVSSNGSWMRRFSLRPISQPASARSSVGPDSLAFSYGSSAPILSPDGSAPPPLAPNKLVKRPPLSSQNKYNDPVTRRRSKTHLPSLRRPATSHQRSATLQSHYGDSPLGSPLYFPPLEQQPPTREFGPLLEQDPLDAQRGEKPGWTSFFHACLVKGSGRGVSTRAADFDPAQFLKRLLPTGTQRQTVYLTQPETLSSGPPPPPGHRTAEERMIVVDDPPTVVTTERPATPQEDSPSSKKARRSISMTFSSPGNWITRSGSLRRPKRGSEQAKGGSQRHVSAPLPGNTAAVSDRSTVMGRVRTTSVSKPRTDESRAVQVQARKRNVSSPLPPISRLSTFNIDMSKLGASTSPTRPQHTIRPHQPSGSSQGSSSMGPPSLSRTRRSPTLNSSDLDGRDFTSGDDDDTDFKSDTIFDSIRTVASGQGLTIETPLDSMFDESPPSTGVHPKVKRLSIQDVMIRNWDGDHDRIMEEDDDCLATPVRTTHHIDGLQEPVSIRKEQRRFPLVPSSNNSTPLNKELGRMSLDDDMNDEDWTRDDESACDHVLSSHLSPPSRGSFGNMRHINPNIRVALASISGNGHSDVRSSTMTTTTTTATAERPLSTLFDWSEPLVHDKLEGDGHLSRPRTVHGKQDIDIRGGRTATRKGPTAAHVRSQSVPVVHDQAESTKQPTLKFGTWGLSSNRASEDWGDDFEFEESPVIEASGKDSCRSFVVPEPIQASQSSVKAHSGQIRELSLLVNDLKRLCRHGREMDMLGGPQASLWKEAEGIIALASPDEDEMMESAEATSSPPRTILSTISDRYMEEGFDVASLGRSEDDFDFSDIPISKTAVVRERPSPGRRPVFSPDDEIFGGWPIPDDAPLPSRPRTPENRVIRGGEDVTGIVRTVMDAMQQRSVSTPANKQRGKVHFDTASLKALVKRAGDLRDILSEAIRRADPIAPSPARTPRHDGSPAFTRVFNEPPTSPSRRLPHSRSTNSVLGRASLDTSSSATLGPKRMQVMTVS